MKQTVEIIGAGHLIRHMMPALASTGNRFIVSARGRETSSWISSHFGAEVSESNQAIVDQADIVILAVRPYDAVSVCGQVSFHARQSVLSLCAGLASAELAPAVAPARLVMAMPVVAALHGESPTLLWPDDEPCRHLLGPCGPVVALASEAQFAPASAIACYYGWVQALVGEMAGWLESRGLEPDTARLLAAQMTRAGATMVREETGTSIDALVSELATPRSFTGKGLDILKARDAFAPWKEAAGALFDDS